MPAKRVNLWPFCYAKSPPTQKGSYIASAHTTHREVARNGKREGQKVNHRYSFQWSLNFARCVTFETTVIQRDHQVCTEEPGCSVTALSVSYLDTYKLTEKPTYLFKMGGSGGKSTLPYTLLVGISWTSVHHSVCFRKNSISRLPHNHARETSMSQLLLI